MDTLRARARLPQPQGEPAMFAFLMHFLAFPFIQ
jgi:hypothetical protein